MATPRVTDDPDGSRFVLREDGELAGFVAYRHPSPGTLQLVHTEISPSFEGRGLAGLLVREVLGQAADQRLAVLPSCPFVRGWIARHPDFTGLVPASERARFGLPPA